MCNSDINAMMNFKPDECIRLMFLSDDTDKGYSEKKIRVDQKESNLWPSGYLSRCSTTKLQETCGY